MRERQSNRPEGSNGNHHSHGGFTRSFLYGPNEIGLVGGAGVDRVVDRLLGSLGSVYRVACLDRGEAGLGDDPERWQALGRGASGVFVAGDDRYAFAGNGAPDRWTAESLWNDADILLVENDWSPALAKIAVVEAGGSVLEKVEREAPAEVVAYVGSSGLPADVDRRMREIAGERPVFDESDSDSLAKFLLELFTQRALSVPLYGLVLGGGRSSRMRRDKATIAYRGVAQVRYAYELLGGMCDRTFVSIRADQAEEEVFAGLEQIHDRFSQIGPMGGILSAMHTHPEAAWLVLGCDLPFVDDRTLRELKSGRDPILQATCYEGSIDSLPEPLCAIYEPRYRSRLHQFLADGRDCPRKALINTRIKRLLLSEAGALDNINSPEDYERAAARIREEAGRAR